MNVFTMVVLIVLIAVVGRIIVARQKGGPALRTSEAEKAELQREIGELKQRIQTLERIATDKSRQLSQEIDALDEKTGKKD